VSGFYSPPLSTWDGKVTTTKTYYNTAAVEYIMSVMLLIL